MKERNYLFITRPRNHQYDYIYHNSYDDFGYRHLLNALISSSTTAELVPKRFDRKTPNYIHCKVAHFRDTLGSKMAYFRQNPFVKPSVARKTTVSEPEPLLLDEDDDDLSLDEATSRWVDKELKWRNEAHKKTRQSLPKLPKMQLGEKTKIIKIGMRKLIRQLVNTFAQILPNLSKLLGIFMIVYGLVIAISNVHVPNFEFPTIPSMPTIASTPPSFPTQQTVTMEKEFENLKAYTMKLEQRLDHLLNYTQHQESSLLNRIGELERRDCDIDVKADKTGMADYALESSGGEIVPEWTSRGLMTSFPLLKLWDIPLFYQTLSPRLAIQPQVNPGNCFGFNGKHGSIGIKLSRHVTVSAITIEHIPKVRRKVLLSQKQQLFQELAPNEDISSAPRNLTISGYSLDDKFHHLGSFQYELGGSPVQTFTIMNNMRFSRVKMDINTNWGNAEYTCVYRIRVHGDIV